MKFLIPLSAIFAIIANFGCSHTEVSSTGFKTTNTNMDWVEWSPTSFKASKLNTSTPLNSTWRGIQRTLDTAVTGAVGIAVPGTGSVPAITRGAAIIAPSMRNNTTAEPK